MSMKNLILSVTAIVLLAIGDVACAQIGPPLGGGTSTATVSSVKATSVSVYGSISPTEPDPAKKVSWTGDGLFTATAAAGDTLSIDYEIEVTYSVNLINVGSATLSATANADVTQTYSLTTSGTGPMGFYGITGEISAGTLTDSAVASHVF